MVSHLSACGAKSSPLPGERLLTVDGTEVLAFCEHGATDRPLVLFLSGGGHLARIAYGHSPEVSNHFLAHWLTGAGYSFLALSFPGSHKIFSIPSPQLSLAEWADLVARIASDTVELNDLSKTIIVVGWSMSGRVIGALSRIVGRYGLEILFFSSLAASAPLPGLIPIEQNEPLDEHGLWDLFRHSSESTGRLQAWSREIGAQTVSDGRAIINADEYREIYIQAHSIHLRGEAVEMEPNGQTSRPRIGFEAIASEYQEFPLTGCVVPTDQSDARHVLTDSATWGLFNAQGLYLRTRPFLGSGSLASDKWQALRQIFSDLPHRLTRHVPGGHFFFVGEAGARRTVRAVESLEQEVRSIRAAIADLVP